MIVTEEEAKTKWCPETLIGGGASKETSRANRWVQPNADGGPIVAGAACIGSECMAWRWLDQVSYVEGHDEPRKCSFGYCGKAGKP